MAKYQKIKIGAPPMNFGGTEVRDAFILINKAIEGLEEVSAKVEDAGGIPGNSDNNFTDELREKLESLPTAEELENSTLTEEEKLAVNTINTALSNGDTLMTPEQAEQLQALVDVDAATRLDTIETNVADLNTSISDIQSDVTELDTTVTELVERVSNIETAASGAYCFTFTESVSQEILDELEHYINLGYMIVVKSEDESNTVLEVENSNTSLVLKFWDDNGVYSITIDKSTSAPYTATKEEVSINADTSWNDVGTDW